MSVAREIVSGRLASGSPISSESDLARRYEVSKTVAREASQLLATLGLIRVSHGKRTIVREESEWEVLSPTVQEAYVAEGLGATFVPELYDVRILLEPHGARVATERADPTLLGEVERILERMERAVGAPDEDFLELDRDFHLAILTALTPNRVLEAMLRDINSLLRSHWALIDLSHDHEEVVAQHRAIADAIGAGDGAAAEGRMREHLAWARERFRRR
jgi:DNA-binding FadR family transcriptional regulator